MTNFDQKGIETETLKNCNGLQSCKVWLDHKYFNVAPKVRNYDQFVFLQVSCEQTSEMLWLKNVLGLAAATLGLAICLLYRNFMVY